MRKKKLESSNVTIDLEYQNCSNQTPIEIALGIDKNGMTTASKLYAFLELNQSNFSRWCNKNILKNKFATENEDYMVFVIEEENPFGGRPRTDYKLTANFAKQLSMTGNTERHNQARNYFIACELGLKVATEKLKQNSIDLKPVTDAITTIAESLASISSRLERLEEVRDGSLPEPQYKKPYNPWFSKMKPKYELLEKYFKVNRSQLHKNILWEMENLYDIDTQQVQADYCYENNLSSCFPMEPFQVSPKYREMIEGIVNGNLVKYGIVSEGDPIASTRHITIFDSPAKKIVNDGLKTENYTVDQYKHVKER